MIIGRMYGCSTYPTFRGVGGAYTVVPSRGKEQEMRNKIRIIGVSLASMAALLLVSGVAWAQALKTEIEGFSENFIWLGEPEREWVDEDGILHVRGQRGTADWFGDVSGRASIGRGESWVADFDRDFAGETYFSHGTSSFYGKILGGELVSATGHYTLDCTGPLSMQTCIAEHIWHVEDGRLLKATHNWVQGDPSPMTYTGFLLDPPGLGPVKRNRPRNR
jgi:hypothetical protein